MVFKCATWLNTCMFLCNTKFCSFFNSSILLLKHVTYIQIFQLYISTKSLYDDQFGQIIASHILQSTSYLNLTYLE